MKNNYKTKRFLAFCVDVFIVSIIILLLSKVNYINPYIKEYNEASEKYLEYTSELVNNKVNSINNEYIDLNYQIQYYGISFYIIYFVVYVLYYTLFPYFNNDQTIGKRLFKIHYESNNGKKIKIYQYFLRSLILPVSISVIMSIPISYIINVLIVLFFKGKTYMYLTEIFSLLISAYCYFDIIYFLANKSKNNMSFHDKLSGIEVKEN